MTTVRMYLANPKNNNYDFMSKTGLGNINVSRDLSNAINFFNGGKVIKRDKGRISMPIITSKYIEITLSWDQGVEKNISCTADNNLALIYIVKVAGTQ